MTTASYPVGNKNFTTAQWIEANGASDGIAYCNGTALTDLRLTKPATGTTVTVGLGVVRFRGFALRVTQSHPLSVPATTGTAVTYSIGVLYDPALQTHPLGDPAPAPGPLSLTCQPKASLTIPSGGAFFPLFEVTRDPGEELAQATVADQRSYVGDLLVGTPNTAAALAAPLGSRLWTGIEELVRVHNAARTGAVWESPTNPKWTNIESFVTGWKERALYQVRAVRVGNWVHITGAVQATSAYPYAACFVLPPDMRPDAERLLGAHQASDGGPVYELKANAIGQVLIDRETWVQGANGTGAVSPGIRKDMTCPVSGSFPISATNQKY